jgi:hypothetical protein
VAIVGVERRRYLEMAAQAALTRLDDERLTDARTLAAQAVKAGQSQTCAKR